MTTEEYVLSLLDDLLELVKQDAAPAAQNQWYYTRTHPAPEGVTPEQGPRGAWRWNPQMARAAGLSDDDIDSHLKTEVIEVEEDSEEGEEEFDEALQEGEIGSSALRDAIDNDETAKNAIDTLAGEGKPYIVGGSVRDALLGKPSKDVDIEVYGIPEDELSNIVETKLGGKKEQIGKSFGVFKVGDIDIALPRTETATGTKHTDFDIKTDPNLPLEQAAKRRDFTFNALMYNYQDDEILDFFGGQEDIENKNIKHVDDDTFVEDPLRVYRAAQFAARFDFSIDPSTQKLAKSMDLSTLPKERIFGEFEKMFLKSDTPSKGIQALEDMGVLDKHFSEIADLKGTHQREDYHAEGDVFTHTKMTLDEAAEIIKRFPDEKDKTIIMLATLCHDLGKPATATPDGRAIGHEEAGVEVAESLLNKLTDDKEIINTVLPIVENHLKPPQFYRNKAGDAAFRRLINKHGLKFVELLSAVSEADVRGRLNKAPDGTITKPENKENEWFRQRVKEVSEKAGTKEGKIAPLITGDDLKELGFTEGRQLGDILRDVQSQQEEGELSSGKEALAYVRDKYLDTAGDWISDIKEAVGENSGWDQRSNFLNPKETIFTDSDGNDVMGAELDKDPNGNLHISSMRSFDRGKGNAGKFLSALTRAADSSDTTMTLIAEPFGEGGLDKEGLKRIYKRNGFVFNNPNDPDTGVREPTKPLIINPNAGFVEVDIGPPKESDDQNDSVSKQKNSKIQKMNINVFKYAIDTYIDKQKLAALLQSDSPFAKFMLLKQPAAGSPSQDQWVGGYVPANLRHYHSEGKHIGPYGGRFSIIGHEVDTEGNTIDTATEQPMQVASPEAPETSAVDGHGGETFEDWKTFTASHKRVTSDEVSAIIAQQQAAGRGLGTVKETVFPEAIAKVNDKGEITAATTLDGQLIPCNDAIDEDGRVIRQNTIFNTSITAEKQAHWEGTTQKYWRANKKNKLGTFTKKSRLSQETKQGRKTEKVANLAKSLDVIRSSVKKHLTKPVKVGTQGPKTVRESAFAIALIDHTFKRIGGDGETGIVKDGKEGRPFKIDKDATKAVLKQLKKEKKKVVTDSRGRIFTIGAKGKNKGKKIPKTVFAPGVVTTYGITDCLPEHIKVKNGNVTLEFLGKDAVPNISPITDPFLKKELLKRKKQGGVGKNKTVVGTSSGSVNKYLKAISGQDITAHKFRSFHATRIARDVIREIGNPPGISKKTLDAKIKNANNAQKRRTKSGDKPGVGFSKEELSNIAVAETKKLQLQMLEDKVASKVAPYLAHTASICLEEYIDKQLFEERGWTAKFEQEQQKHANRDLSEVVMSAKEKKAADEAKATKKKSKKSKKSRKRKK